MNKLYSILLASIFILLNYTSSAKTSDLIFVCNPDNDLYKVATESLGTLQRTNSISDAISNAPEGAGLLILADNYPEETVKITAEEYEQVNKKGFAYILSSHQIFPVIKRAKYRKQNGKEELLHRMHLTSRWRKCVL
jgi:hypothetical protein